MIERNVRKNIILTADDFGKSEKANENILKLAKAGKLDRVSVMIDGDISSEEVRELIAADVKLDIHFELIWQKRRRNLLQDNTLRQGAVFLLNYLWGDWPVPEHPRSGASSVSREWNGQIEKFKKIFGRTPDGISSHEHTHFFPAYFRITVSLAKRHGILFVRFGIKGFLGEKNCVYLILSAMRQIDRRKFFNSKLTSSEYFSSLDWLIGIDKFLKNHSEEKIEIACHPERPEEFELIKKYF